MKQILLKVLVTRSMRHRTRIHAAGILASQHTNEVAYEVEISGGKTALRHHLCLFVDD